MREAKAGGADASRLHGLRGERSNVPREARLFTKRGKKKNTYIDSCNVCGCCALKEKGTAYV